ncbi:MAG: transposase, partial [Sutterella wadsworthensis]
MIPFFQFAPEIRTQIYTINSIEGLNRAVRKVIKTRTLFPNLKVVQNGHDTQVKMTF